MLGQRMRRCPHCTRQSRVHLRRCGPHLLCKASTGRPESRLIYSRAPVSVLRYHASRSVLLNKVAACWLAFTQGAPKLKVAIVGSGLAGLSTAVELLDQGYEVDIYEQRPFVGGKVTTCISRTLGDS